MKNLLLLNNDQAEKKCLFFTELYGRVKVLNENVLPQFKLWLKKMYS